MISIVQIRKAEFHVPAIYMNP